jgi:hypothetical protein
MMDTTTTRRRFLLSVAGAATIAVGIASNPFGRFFGGQAAAASFGGRDNRREIRIFHRFGQSVPTVQVDGRELPPHLFGRGQLGMYTTHLLPFEDFPNRQSLATELAKGADLGIFVL